VNAAPPAVVTLGESELIVGPFRMAKAAPVEFAPPELTVMFAVPALAMRLAGTEAVSCVELTNAVVSADPFHWTTALEAKLLPVTARVKAGPPAVAELGLNIVIVGPALIVNCAAPEVTPPELTVILTVPALAIKAAETEAVNWLALWTVVGTGDPFHWAMAPPKNPLPFTVSVKAGPPEVAEFGLREVIAGAGGAIVNGNPLVVAPAESTVTVAVPAVAIRVAETEAVS
jgi:hypothetical protein